MSADASSNGALPAGSAVPAPPAHAAPDVTSRIPPRGSVVGAKSSSTVKSYCWLGL